MSKKYLIDILIIILILVLIIFLALSFYKTNQGKKYVLITSLNQKYYYPLDQDNTFITKGFLGETKIRIKDGKVSVLDSCCKNKICTNSSISKAHQVIVCLPNKVSIEIKGKEDEIDSVAY